MYTALSLIPSTIQKQNKSPEVNAVSSLYLWVVLLHHQSNSKLFSLNYRKFPKAKR